VGSGTLPAWLVRLNAKFSGDGVHDVGLKMPMVSIWEPGGAVEVVSVPQVPEGSAAVSEMLNQNCVPGVNANGANDAL